MIGAKVKIFVFRHQFLKFSARTRSQDLWPFLISDTGLESRRKLITVAGPGACFSKVPIINGPGKLSPFSKKIEVSIVLHVT